MRDMGVTINQDKLLKISGIFGLLSFLVLFICLSSSIFYFTGFNWTNNWISQLAGSYGDTPIWSANGASALLLNFGLIISGLFGIIFSILISKSLKFKCGIGRHIPTLIFIDMVAMCCCGVFPITLGKLHSWSSLVFLGLIPIILITTGFEIKKIYGKKYWIFSNVSCFFILLSFCFFALTPKLSGFNRAIAEMVLIISIFSIINFLSFKMLGWNLILKRYLVNVPRVTSPPHVLYKKKIFRLLTSKG